ncbi:MAG: 1-acyl-sn-glycerol-3-phosphate acyltransferase [Desulfatiglans sp.]|jgi:1-acyl-sn-glycerol-3-phosphate acyltransferase|nr:1-acyl-sn-glycerol-3-phosphate acyltransferase [Desulfatiglans sp.]
MTASVILKRNLFVAGIVRLAAKAFLFPFFRMNVSGADNLPENGAFVLLPRHQRWEDIPLIAISVKRPLYYIAKQELFDSFIIKRFISMVGGIPLDRKRPARNRNTCSSLLQKLSDGEGVVLFPEGTYYKDQIGKGHPGMIRYVYENVDTLFVPAGIEYIKQKYRADVRINIGNPLRGADFKDSQLLFATIMSQIAQLSGLRDNILFKELRDNHEEGKKYFYNNR